MSRLSSSTILKNGRNNSTNWIKFYTHTHAPQSPHHAQYPSFRQSVKWLGLLGWRLHIHCYGDGARVLSKEAEMIYREVHPSWMAMRQAHPPNNTSAWRTSGPFNLMERVPCGHLWGHLSHHQVMWGSRSPSIAVVSGDMLHQRVLP